MKMRHRMTWPQSATIWGHRQLFRSTLYDRCASKCLLVYLFSCEIVDSALALAEEHRNIRYTIVICIMLFSTTLAHSAIRLTGYYVFVRAAFPVDNAARMGEFFVFFNGLSSQAIPISSPVPNPHYPVLVMPYSKQYCFWWGSPSLT